MTDQGMQLPVPSGKNAVSVPRIKKYQAALREATKIERGHFTDAIKAFCEYEDRTGKKATAPERAYGNFTRQVYAAFGLNTKQIAARMNGDAYGRDHFDTLELAFVQSAERAATTALLLGMDRELTRDEIKKGVKRAIEHEKESYGYMANGKMFPEAAKQ